MCWTSPSSARMFLMNTATPLIALQGKWEPFPQTRSYRYPVCFSESEDDIARTSVNAKVQMIIKNLQSEESPLSTAKEYGCILQKKRKGMKIRGHKLRGSGRVPSQKHVAYAQHSCPADSDGMEVEDSSEFGPLSLNSDSDDSVDREIEEAIQEYLKNKGQSIPPLPSNAKSSPNTNTDKSPRKEQPPHDIACNVFPTSVDAGLIPQHLVPGFLGDDAPQWTHSPCSVSSDDSFEQSIKAEIEQFLHEKKQQTKKKVVTGGSKNIDQKDAQEKLAIRSQKNGTSKVSPASLKQQGKVTPGPACFTRHSEPQNTNTPPKCWMLKTEGFVNFRKPSQAHFKAPGAGHSCMLEQSHEIRQTFQKHGEQSPESANLSDSSSDDGIEEAIQLYQLEKIRKAAQAGWVPSQKEKFGASGLADLSASLTIHSEKSALPENPRTVLSSKRKQISLRSTELNRIDVISDELGKGKRSTSPANNFATSAGTLPTCRADTAAELLCAEAILDISKTILPPPVPNNNRSLLTDPFFHSQSVLSSHQESDNNSVDSDDSIEQEIRAFLAIKAQTECSTTLSYESSNTAPNPLPSGQPSDQTWSRKGSFPGILKLSLGQKRKLKKEMQRQDKQMPLLEIGYSHLGSDNYSYPFASQEENILSSVKNSETGGAVRKQEVSPATVSSVDFISPLSPGLLRTSRLVKNTTSALERYCVDDKSSSLDSDEDLDTAIKDLLKSKRKLKKKSKYQKIQCRKKVRFGNAQMCIFEDELEIIQEKDCKSPNPTMLKSCLMTSRRNSREDSAQKVSQYIVKGRRPQHGQAAGLVRTSRKGGQAVSGPDNPAGAVSDQHSQIATPLIEDSSSLDSDDSIEQEIQRFLAEKAKDSSRTVGIAGAFGIVDTVKAAQINQGVEQVICDSLSVKRTAVKRKRIFDGPLDQRSLPPWKEKAETCKLKKYFKPISPFKRKSTHEFNISSKIIAGFRGAQKKKKSVLLRKRQNIELTVLQGSVFQRQERLLGERCKTALQKRILGSKDKMEKADLGPRCMTEKLYPHVSEKTEEVSFRVGMVSLAKVGALGDKEFCSQANSKQHLLMQEPSVDNGRGADVSSTPSEIPVQEKGNV